MRPYLSVVMGIGGNVTDDLISRLDASAMVLFCMAARFALSIELLIVDWNMPTTRNILVVVPSEIVKVRIIHTPQELHLKVPNPHGFRYFEWYPKNIGIRRAQGEFVLSTNPDDIWSEDLAKFFSRRELKRGHFYRVNRHDTRDGKVFRVCRSTGCFDPEEDEQFIRTQISPHAAPWSENMIHYNASGDFTLMSKDDWFLIRGNPELDYNHSVDGQTLFLASQMGLKQIVLPYPIYHPDHVRTLNHAYAPEWDDNFPTYVRNNENWGFAGMEFEERIL